MPLIGALFGVIFRSLARIFSFLFGWAIVSFFGKMPAAKQYLLSGIAALALIWWFLIISLLWPPVVTLLGRVQPQVASHRSYIALFALPALFVLPLIIGGLSLYVDAKPSPGLGSKVKQLFQGYLIAPGFGIAIALMVLLAIWLVVYQYARRLHIEHLPIMLKTGGYDAVMHDLEQALRQDGFTIQVRPLPWLLRPPEWVLAKFAGTLVKDIATEEPRMIVDDKDLLTIIVHPSDIAISARGNTAGYVRAIITTNVPFTEAYLTWDKSAQAYEDQVYNVWQRYRSDPLEGFPEALQEIDRLKGELYVKGVPYDQWAVLYRELLQVEEALIVTPVRHAGVQAAVEEVAREQRAPTGSFAGIRHLRQSVAQLTGALGALVALFRRGKRCAKA